MTKETDKITMAVFEFSGLMEEKMLAKYEQGYRNWDDPQFKTIIEQKLYTNMREGDYVDVANFAMMLYNLKKQGATNDKTDEGNGTIQDNQIADE